MSGHDGGFERRRDPDSPLLYSVSKTVSFSAKIIAHRTNLGSMANPLLPKNPSPIMLAIVAFRFGFFFFSFPPSRLASGCNKNHFCSRNTEQGISTTISLRGSVGKERPFSSG